MVLFKLTFQVQPGTCCMGLISDVVVGSVPQGHQAWIRQCCCCEPFLSIVLLLNLNFVNEVPQPMSYTTRAWKVLFEKLSLLPYGCLPSQVQLPTLQSLWLENCSPHLDTAWTQQERCIEAECCLDDPNPMKAFTLAQLVFWGPKNYDII